ncbi:MAG TPA: coproporphyrinogen-III oxidase family protein [Planctomycetota bacterium]|nr:coproporphyrinogen-III oxidase family protein [Planctomycetota bacterium]
METTVGNYFVSNYPPFSTWSKDDLPLLESALEVRAPGEPIALYVHLPFCRQRCHYCYYRVYPSRDREAVDRYIDGLLSELKEWRRRPVTADRRLIAAYFGGGSPSYLEPDQLDRLLLGIRRMLPWMTLEECAFECDPGSIDRAKLDVLYEHGVTRLSIGTQTFTPAALSAIGRLQTPEMTVEAYRSAIAAGFEEINIDLLAGLPGETVETWRRTIDRVIALAPPCVTVYQLELSWNSILHTRARSGRNAPQLPDWQTKREWVDEAFATLEAAGYSVVSGYMAVKDPSSWRFIYTVEHFWRGGDLLAIGESSFGHFRGVHYQNLDRQDTYLAAVESGRLPLRRARSLTFDETLRRELILALKTGRADREWFLERHGVDIAQEFAKPLKELEEAGFLRIENDGVTLTRDGLLRVDSLLDRFYRPEHRGVRYS